MLKMSTVEARENFSEMINQAAYGNQSVVLTRRGKPLVAVVSLQSFEELQAAVEKETV
ncbi:MAG: type II toxin-antitoxin system Phd/YefM family antitoxin [Gammaproteobacteria bacterium]|nr:type II toxin-antitoxin system Phd/YefM family antitoxin [Gammaproteobacteria bacterium]